MRRLSPALALAPILLLAPPAGRAISQELRAKKEDSAAARLREMDGLARAVVIKATDQPDAKPAELAPEPIFRYDDPPRQIEDATLWVFGRTGRPTAALKVEVYPNRGLYGLVALAPGTITAKGTDWDWASTAPGIELRPIPDAPPPAAAPHGRRTQLRALSGRFSGHEFEPSKGRMQMRLLPRPLLRYDDPAAGLLDGAILSLSFGVNPEVLLLIEARKAAGEAAPTWQYGVGRLGGAEVSVSLDGQEVWRQGKAYPVPQVRPTYMNRHLRRVEGAE